MQRRTKITIAGAAVTAAALAVGGGIAAARVGDDDEAPITGAAPERATAAGLEHTGEGRVTETEVGDEDSLYEVEITLDDGRQVDVQIDANFAVVGASADIEGDDDESGD